MNTVFVYGLLKPGHSLHHIVAPFVSRALPATARGRLYAAAYPQIPAGRFDEDGEIDGFVYWLDEVRTREALRILDEVEDEGVMYDRLVIEVSTADGVVEAFAYHYLLPIDGCRDVGPVWPV